MKFNKIKLPEKGELITSLEHIPNNPYIAYIEGDGIGVDVSPAMRKVVDAAMETCYSKQKYISWVEVYAGEKANEIYGDYLPDETIEALKYFKVGIKGPLTTPVGGGFRSLNVAIRQQLDLFVCLRPIRYYAGVPTPLLHPEHTNMVIFRENSEDIYAGIEWQAGSDEADKVIKFLQDELDVTSIRFPEQCGIGIKPISHDGTKRIIRSAIDFAIRHNRDSVTIVHKGNIMKYTEGAFKDWGYEVAKEEYNAELLDGGPWMKIRSPDTGKDIIIKDVIADAFLQQILLRPKEYDIVVTMNLNGDYISDALAAQVGGIGIAPGANLSDQISVFEATHGTAPKYAGLDKVNPGSVILSAVMMLEELGFIEAASCIEHAFAKTILDQTVTYDLARLMEDPKEVSCSKFAANIISNMTKD